MQPFMRCILGFVALGLLVIVGCQRLNVDKTIKLSPGEVQDVIIDGPRSQQNVNVEITSSEKIDVYVILSANEEAVKGKLLGLKAPDPALVLAKETKVENAVLKATIPAKSEFRVLLTGAKKAVDVKVKITNS